MPRANSEQPGLSRWDERYAGEEYVFGTEPNGFLATVAPRLERGRALCIADGEGRNSVYLAELGFRVTAMDASAVGMQKASRLALERNVPLTTVVADLRDYSFGRERWDLIVSIFCHLPPELRRDVYRRAVDGLRRDGAIVVEAYTPRQLEYGTGGPSSEDLLVRLDDLRVDLEGLRLKTARETVRPVIEGRGHTGEAAVVQVVGFKQSSS